MPNNELREPQSTRRAGLKDSSFPRRLDLVLGGFFLASWVLATVFTWFSNGPGTLDLDLYRLYAVAGFLGWAGGNFFIWRSRGVEGPSKLGLGFLSFLGPVGVIFLLRALAPVERMVEAPLASLYAFGVFSVFFLVPVTLRPRRRNGRKD